MSSLAPPFTGLDWSQRGLLLAMFAAVSAWVMLRRIEPIDQVLQSRVPGGILALEFAWSGERASAILASWHGLEDQVRSQTLWDYLFLLCYPPALALACAMLCGADGNPVAMIGTFVAWAVLAATPLDAIENLAMMAMVSHGASEVLAKLAGWCAGLKFTVLLAAVGYLLTAGAATFVRRYVLP
ncbi:MAG: hypothetical protein H6945_15360 [Zoogloeaceae bacterium]|nr:hypothetical protein [Rhodocyclaceae bacterium]MCP5237114.1 hypothetical protein [Zoogloeaceae bacterium]